MGPDASAMAPIVAREVIKMEFSGCNEDDIDAKPALVILRLVSPIHGPSRAVISVGVAQLMSPSQNASFFVEGVLPPKT